MNICPLRHYWIDDLAHLILVDNPSHNPDGDFLLKSEGFIDLVVKADLRWNSLLSSRLL